MALSKVKRPVKTRNPRTLLLFGPPKVGKTTVLSQLPECMVIDTEQGSHLLEGYFHEVNSKEELLEFYKSASEGHDYKFFALDTIDKLVEWSDKAVCKEFHVESIADMPYGKGFGEVRTRVMNNVKKLLTLAPHVIIVGHRKIASAIDNSMAIEPESLDISGKLKNMIMAHADAIGYMFRDDEDELMVSFKGGQALEAGSRCEHLKGKVMPFDWNKIYTKEEGDK
tara:strand:- start:2693 stop:3367 length:675 start_codon:yes stop_codon:yes gene_type:complete